MEPTLLAGIVLAILIPLLLAIWLPRRSGPERFEIPPDHQFFDLPYIVLPDGTRAENWMLGLVPIWDWPER